MLVALAAARPPRPLEEAPWVEALRALARRRLAPAPRRRDLDALDRARMRVSGGFVAAWLRTRAARAFAQRHAALGESPEGETAPLVVVHGDAPLLAACRVLLGRAATEGEGRSLCLLDAEYDAFLERHPEPRSLAYHVEVWSRFVPASGAALAAAAGSGKSIDPGSPAYLVHESGAAWATGWALSDASLWRWDGADLEIVAAGLTLR